MKHLVFLFLFSLCHLVYAQAQVVEEDVLYLKNGSVLRGKVLEMKPGGHVKIEIMGGSIFVYPMEEVIEIKKEPVLQPKNTNTNPNPNTNTTTITYPNNNPNLNNGITIIHRPLQAKTKGLYNVSSTRINVGINSWSGISGGIGLQHITGYQFNRFAAVGGGIGIEYNTGHNFVPLFVDFRGYLMPTSTSLYYSVNIGYAFALKGRNNDWRTLVKSEGGLYIHPAVGVRFGSANKVHFVMDIGYCFQQAAFTYSDTWSGGGEYTERSTWVRPTMRFGVLF